jgi:hypothetical protein
MYCGTTGKLSDRSTRVSIWDTRSSGQSFSTERTTLKGCQFVQGVYLPGYVKNYRQRCRARGSAWLVAKGP